jgi:hypothetical protein
MATFIKCNKIYVSDTAPDSKLINKFWFDSTLNRLHRYDGTSWVPIEMDAGDVYVVSDGTTMSLQSFLSIDPLNTTSKTIVGAINELNTKLLSDVPAPITNIFTSTSTSLTSIITDTTKKDIQGKILISPNINNLGAIYAGQSVTDKTKAFPLYPNQIVSFSFTDITNFKVATDVIGDKFNYVIEFGILNAAVTPAEGLIIVGTDGSKYRLNPSGDVGSETFTLTKIS